MSEDAELLARYSGQKSEQAFAAFVGRHVDFVYNCALRRVGGDEHFAKDVTQQVFVAAAREAPALARHPVVTGWLFTTARHVAAQLVRTERRRQVREQQANAMEDQNESQPAVNWDHLRPVLDQALDGLGETERQAVLLRFFENKSFAEVGARLRLAENAARMRVDRALDKMSVTLGRHGVTSTAAALAVALSSQGGAAAPVGLAAAATGAALASSSTGVAATVLTFMGMTKLQIGLAGALAVAGATGLVTQARQTAAVRQDLVRTEQQLQAGASITVENTRLKQARAATLQESRARTAELVQLREQIGELRDRIARTDAGAKNVRSLPGHGSEGTETRVFDMAALDVTPVLTSQKPPKYPFELRKAGTTGAVAVDFVVDPEGKAQNVYAVDGSDPAFVDAAVKAVETWTFKPGEKDGQPVATHMQIPIVFSLKGEEPPEAKSPPVKSAGGATWF